MGTVYELLPSIASTKPVASQWPLSMEEMGVGAGFVLYTTAMTRDYSAVRLNVSCIRDRGYVFVDQVNTRVFSVEFARVREAS